MKVFVVSMIRDEIDVMAAFCKHIDALFDGGILIDHRSVDGTQEALKQFCDSRPSWRFHRVEDEVQDHSRVSNTYLPEAFAAGADYVTFLDADEFIRGSADAYRSALRQLSGQMGCVFWRNCAPASYEGAFNLDDGVKIGPLSKHRKIIVSRQVFETSRSLFVRRGNHSATSDGETIPSVRVGEMYHFPVRSREQIARKVVRKAMPELQSIDYFPPLPQSRRSDPSIDPHFISMYDLFVKHGCTPKLMDRLAANYGLNKPFSKFQPLWPGRVDIEPWSNPKKISLKHWLDSVGANFKPSFDNRP